jgi:hypothetical protein
VRMPKRDLDNNPPHDGAEFAEHRWGESACTTMSLGEGVGWLNVWFASQT